MRSLIGQGNCHNRWISKGVYNSLFLGVFCIFLNVFKHLGYVHDRVWGSSYLADSKSLGGQIELIWVLEEMLTCRLIIKPKIKRNIRILQISKKTSEIDCFPNYRAFPSSYLSLIYLQSIDKTLLGSRDQQCWPWKLCPWLRQKK